MELEPKILKVTIRDNRGERNVFFDKKNFYLTYGSSKRCDISIPGAKLPRTAKLINKTGDNIELLIDASLKGFLRIASRLTNIGELVKSGILKKKQGRYRVPVYKHYSGQLELETVKIEFGFEKAAFEALKSIPIPSTGLFSLSRLKAIGETFFKILTYSFLIHAIVLSLIIIIPKPIIKEKVIPFYRHAKVDLSVSKLKPLKEIVKKPPAVEANKTDKSLFAMIDSKRQLKGFVRNLFFSKADTFDFSVADGSADTDSGGLFTRIETKRKVVNRKDLAKIGPLFASVKGSSELTKDSSLDLFESELTIESPEIEGTLNRDTISKIVSTHEGVLRFCYEEALIRKPKASGRIVILFKISPDGTTEETKIESSTLNDRTMEDCILRKVKNWRFPKPDKGKASIRYPFVFYTSRTG